MSNRNHCSFYGKQNKVDTISYGYEESPVATFVSKALHCFFLTKIKLGETESNYHKSNVNARVGMIWNF